MPTPVTHAVAALAIGSPWYRSEIPKRVWVAAALCSAIPDLDVVGFRVGVHYGDFWGHRGFTHSLMFAALLAASVVVVLSRKVGMSRVPLFTYLFLATASHGLLDAMTNGGLGIAFFSPFDNHRYFFPWRPIRVSPITISTFFTGREFAIMRTEFLWVWLPSVIFALAVTLVRWRFGTGNRDATEVAGAGNRT